MNPITKAWNAVVSLVRRDVDAIIADFLRVQSKLDSFIKAEEAKLQADAAAIDALVKRTRDRNTVVNRAYRIIHNIDGLFA